jgi:hypothetical protein
MRLVRSWPADPPAGHARVDDRIERVFTEPFDYAPLAKLGDDLLHLDWDMAVSPEDLAVFAAAARAQPYEVLVGPYLTYPGSLFGNDPAGRDLPDPVWTGKVYTSADETAMRNIVPGDRYAHMFGFGMVYLPAMWLSAFTGTFPGVKMGDGQFSGWYYRQSPAGGPGWVNYGAAICWDVHPVHCNYPPPKEL